MHGGTGESPSYPLETFLFPQSSENNELDSLQLPCHLDELAACQKQHCEVLQDTLKHEWRRSFAEHLVDNVQDGNGNLTTFCDRFAFLDTAFMQPTTQSYQSYLTHHSWPMNSSARLLPEQPRRLRVRSSMPSTQDLWSSHEHPAPTVGRWLPREMAAFPASFHCRDRNWRGNRQRHEWQITPVTRKSIGEWDQARDSGWPQQHSDDPVLSLAESSNSEFGTYSQHRTRS